LWNLVSSSAVELLTLAVVRHHLEYQWLVLEEYQQKSLPALFLAESSEVIYSSNVTSPQS
jgi:hypothetical protein